jgi:hypothetical protein
MKRVIIIVASGILVFLIFASAIFFVLAKNYENKITPNVFVGTISVGGLDTDTAREILQTKIDHLVTNGIPIQINNETKQLALATLVSSDLNEEAVFDLDKAMRRAQNVSILSLWPLRKKNIPLSVSIAKENLQKNISELFPDSQTPVQDSRFIIVPTAVDNNWFVKVSEDRPGKKINWIPFFQKLETQLMNLNDSEIAIDVQSETPTVSKQLAEEQTEQVSEILSKDEISISYFDSRGQARILEITKWKLSTMLIPTAVQK